MRLSVNGALKGFLLFSFFTSWSGAYGQSAEMVSTFVFDGEKALFVDGDQMVVGPAGLSAGTLSICALSSGAVLESFGTGIHTFQEVNGKRYVLSNQINPAVFKLFQYANAALELLYEEPINADLDRALYASIEGVTDGLAALPIEGGLLVVGTDMLFEREVHPDWSFQGWTAQQERLFAVFDLGAAELDPTTFEVIGEAAFTEPWQALQSARAGQYVLLQDGTWNAPADYRIFNLLTTAYTELSDGFGNVFPVPKMLGDNLFTDGKEVCFAVEAPFSFSTNSVLFSPKQGLARIDLESGIGKVFPATNQKREAREAIQFHESANGTVAFAKLESSGTEPYLFSKDGFELIKDIHPGGARGVEIPSMQGWVNLNSNLKLETFDAISANGIVYFAANEPRTGREIWCSDGTAKGTQLCAELAPGVQGIGPAYFSQDGQGRVYVVSGLRPDNMRLYRLPYPANEPDISKPTPNKWLRSFGLSDELAVMGWFHGTQSANLHPAVDGSVASLYNGFYADYDWMAYGDTAHIPASWVVDGAYVRSVAYVHNADGSLRSQISIQCGSDNVYMARQFDSGEMLFAVRYRLGTTIFNGQPFYAVGEGIHIFKTDDLGNLIWAKTFSGTRIAIRSLTFGQNGFYALGWLQGEVQFGAGNTPIFAPDGLPCLFAFDDDGVAQWASAFDQPNENFGGHRGALYKLTYDGLSNRVFAATGGTGFNTTGSCAFSEVDMQVAAFDGSNGQRIWNRTLASSDHIRPTSIAVLPDGRMWLSGHTRGDLELGTLKLPKTENFMPCSWNGFHAVFNGTNGTPLSLQSDEPNLAKIIFDTQVKDNLIYIASVVMDGTNSPHPITGFNSGLWLQVDAMAPNGTVLDSKSWELSKGYQPWNINDILRDQQVGLSLHPKEGMYVSILNMTQGGIGDEYAMASQKHNTNSFSIMRTASLQPDYDLIPVGLTAADALMVYPNPTSINGFNFQVNLADLGVFEKISVYDVQGKLIYVEAINPLLINAFVSLPAHLRRGLYTLVFEGDGPSEAVKLMLNN